jgi:hypothetical protein
LIQGENAALAGAAFIGEVDRWRIQIGGVRPFTVTRRAMTTGAMLGEQRGAPRQIGSRGGRQGNRIGLDQIRGHGARRYRDGLGRIFVRNQLLKRDGLLLQTHLGRCHRKKRDAFAG